MFEYKYIDISMFALRGASISWCTIVLSVTNSLFFCSFYSKSLYDVMSEKHITWHDFWLKNSSLRLTMN